MGITHTSLDFKIMKAESDLEALIKLIRLIGNMINCQAKQQLNNKHHTDMCLYVWHLSFIWYLRAGKVKFRSICLFKQ